MKKLTPPSYNDDVIATNLSVNNRLRYANPDLRDNLNTVLGNYNTYILNSGDPWIVSENGGLPTNLNEALKMLYKSSPADLSVLSDLRKNSSIRVCPMCGGFGNGTLDHYLPQNSYPQYSIFTKNLIPACNCNSLRKEKLKGANNSERVLHPYYDTCLQQRALSVEFSADFESPTVTIINCYPAGAINHDAVRYHIDEIVSRTNIKEWMITMWADLMRTPRSILDTLPNSEAVTEVILRDCINNKMLAKEEEFETPNNWGSVFFHGLLNSPGASFWLTDYINHQ